MLGRGLAIKNAENYRYLRKKCVTVRKTTDIMIDTFCIHHNISLLHDDAGFEPLTKYLKLDAIKL